MKNMVYCAVVALVLCACSSKSSFFKKSPNYCSYVNTLIGTGNDGHTYPGATTPFGLIQASPETGNDGWRYCSGFNYEDDSIIGFAQTHLSGTGAPGLGDVLIFPFLRDNKTNDYKSGYDKESQIGQAGYYSVMLTDDSIRAEMTATQRTAFYRFTYPNSSKPRLLLDLQNGIAGWGRTVEDLVLSADMDFLDSCTIVGHNNVITWVKRHYYFAVRFDKPYKVKEVLPKRKDTEMANRMVLEFEPETFETLHVKVGYSTVSIDGALDALNKENSAWNFDEIKDKAQLEWNNHLGRIEVEGTDEQKTAFYTSMYHTMIQPNNITDCDGKYRGSNDSVAVSVNGDYYTTFSLWDTYRAAHALYTLVVPERVGAMVQSMIDHYKVQGILPIWTLMAKEANGMIGNHAIPVIVDAYLKGFGGFDPNEAFTAIKETSVRPHLNSEWDVYTRYGYYPFDITKVESVSRTLESSFDDYCVAMMAKAMGKEEDYQVFTERANYYKNLFDPVTKLMRGKDSKGQWRTPFNSLKLSHATTSGGDYTEGNAWQYTWHVQHDVNGLIDMMGGPEEFTQKLDTLFFLESHEKNSGWTKDVTGLIGQYAHGNEPSHHVAYLYSHAGKSWKTHEIIREIFDRFYIPKSDGLCGNDDCGQMSAWYVFSSLGFYPVNPVGMKYTYGAPQLPKATIHLADGKQFIIEAKNLSRENKYVESITLNGRSVENCELSHQDILNGGNLVFNMTNKK